jgi:hypothetical protein
LKANLQPLAIAVDEIGNELADAIDQHRDEWTAAREHRATEAEQRFLAAIEAVRAAASDLGPARSGIAWLAEFNVEDAKAGREFPFGARPIGVRVEIHDGIHDRVTVDRLLEIVARAAEGDAPAGAVPRRVKTVAARA